MDGKRYNYNYLPYFLTKGIWLDFPMTQKKKIIMPYISHENHKGDKFIFSLTWKTQPAVKNYVSKWCKKLETKVRRLWRKKVKISIGHPQKYLRHYFELFSEAPLGPSQTPMMKFLELLMAVNYFRKNSPP